VEVKATSATFGCNIPSCPKSGACNLYEIDIDDVIYLIYDALICHIHKLYEIDTKDIIYLMYDALA
jgi:hypothetical protein